MESKITLSPWHANAIKAGRIIGDETVNDTFDKITINSHNATVATVYRRADARLIKAAPELLEALKAIKASLGQPVFQSTNEDAAACRIMRGYSAHAWEWARQAILKAEGGE
jgi:hypothetical protein